MSASTNLIRLNQITFRYPDAAGKPTGPPVLDDISLALNLGEFVGVVGQNGSGKTTLARHLNGLLKPDRGSVMVADQDTHDTEPGRLTRYVGYVFQNPDHALFLTSVREEINYSLSFQRLSDDERRDRLYGALDTFGLTEMADRHPASLGRGARRLVVLAAAYAMAPALLVLDEPTGGLDHELTTRLMQTLDCHVKAGRSALLISHDMQLIADCCDRVLVLAAGRLVADCSPGDLFQNPELLNLAGLRAPEIATLAMEMEQDGIPASAVSKQRFIEAILNLKRSGSLLNRP